MVLLFLYLLVSCGLLAWSADRFVVGASVTARYFQLPPLIVGVTLVGFATSFPEVLVSLVAALKQQPALSLGNALGSYITNIGLVLGGSALVKPLRVHSRLLRREYPMMIVAFLLVWLLLLDGSLNRLDSSIMLLAFIGELGCLTYFVLHKKRTEEGTWFKRFKQHSALVPDMPFSKALAYLALGLVVLYLSSELLIYSASNIARALGVSELMIGLTVVAVGTSLPELAASIISVLRNEPDIAIGNVIGSNMFGVLVVTAMPGLFSPGKIDRLLLWREFPIMAGMTILLCLLSVGLKKPATLTRLKGGLLLLSFIVYWSLLFFQGA